VASVSLCVGGVCVSVHAVRGKRLELSMPKLVSWYMHTLYGSGSACNHLEVKRSKAEA